MRRWQWLGWPRSAGAHAVGLRRGLRPSMRVPPGLGERRRRLAEVIFCSRLSTVPSVARIKVRCKNCQAPCRSHAPRPRLHRTALSPASSCSFVWLPDQLGQPSGICAVLSAPSLAHKVDYQAQRRVPGQTPPASRGLRAAGTPPGTPWPSENFPEGDVPRRLGAQRVRGLRGPPLSHSEGRRACEGWRSARPGWSLRGGSGEASSRTGAERQGCWGAGSVAGLEPHVQRLAAAWV